MVLTATAIWAEPQRPWPAASFYVTWYPRLETVPEAIEGLVLNDSPYHVTDVRLRVEGFDANKRLVGERMASALGDIESGGETSYVIETIPGAVDYRVTVAGIDVMTVHPTALPAN